MDFERYLESVGQPVLILDRLWQVVAANRAFLRLFPETERGENIHVYAESYPALLPCLHIGEGSVAMAHAGRNFAATVSFLRHGRNQTAARCVCLSDVTPTVALIAEAERQNDVLRQSNEEVRARNELLKEHARIEQEAEALRVKALLLRNVHDTLGHALVVAEALLNGALRDLEQNEEAEAGEKLGEALRRVSLSIAELASFGDYGSGSFVEFLHRFRDSMKQAGIAVSLEISGEERPCHGNMFADLTRICQEAATNAIKHGKADRIEIAYRAGPEDVTLHIKDNGKSVQAMGKGLGLGGMAERADNLFGDLAYGFAAGGGFFVRVDAPVIPEEEEMLAETQNTGAPGQSFCVVTGIIQ